MASFLLAIITLVAILQPTGRRLAAGFIFAAANIFFTVIVNDLPGEAYYIAAAFSDLGIVILLKFIYDDLARKLQFVCLLSILVNFTGWLMWFLYYPPLVYNVVYLLVFLIAIYFLLTNSGGRRVSLGYVTAISRRVGIFRDGSAMRSNHHGVDK